MPTPKETDIGLISSRQREKYCYLNSEYKGFWNPKIVTLFPKIKVHNATILVPVDEVIDEK